MRRTNIYLGDEQCSALDEIARSNGTSRAELIRQLIDRAITSDQQDLAGDLLAIDGSFGALAAEDVVFERGDDARWRHLEDSTKT
ncbi:MAG: CopG family transcriptional regulator [Acidimicrobiales bacterium]